MFAVIPETKSSKSSFVSIVEGSPVILQILSEQATRNYIHKIKTSDGRFVRVEHTPECVICRNQELRERYKPYYSYRAVVLNVTPVVKCPLCGATYSTISVKRVPERCLQDGADLTHVAAQPLNEVQILEGGVTLFRSLNAIIDTMKASIENFNLSTFALQFNASGAGLKKTIAIIPRIDIKGVVFTGDLPDLSLPKFSEVEVSQMLSGTPLTKIIEMRRVSVQQSQNTSGLDFSGLVFPDLPGI